jgi:hypothetical protein
MADTRLREGIPLAEATVEDLRELGKMAGVPFPALTEAQ